VHSISIIAAAVTKLENNQFPAHFSKNEAGVYNQLLIMRPYFRGPMKVLASNLWLFAPLMKKILLGASNAAAAMLRTTTATTVIKGGTKTNVLPYNVKAYVNHRIHPSESVDSVVERDIKIINDPRVTVKKFDMEIPPSPVSSITNKPWGWIEASVSEVFNNPTTCSIMIGNTDTRWYWDLSDSIYRFSPVELNIKDLGMFHGLDERISVDGVERVVAYYTEIIKRANE
jgi:carboxypeptidase PM20D1